MGFISAGFGILILSMGLRQDFTSTIIADSYVVKGGKIDKPLRPNTVRINNNIKDILNNIIAVSKIKTDIVWGGEAVVFAPEIAVQGVSWTISPVLYLKNLLCFDKIFLKILNEEVRGKEERSIVLGYITFRAFYNIN